MEPYRHQKLFLARKIRTSKKSKIIKTASKIIFISIHSICFKSQKKIILLYSTYSAGLDLKYGLTNSFTLDLTLIPDFGQVTFDDEELNLGPFEQQFDENRPFFTEGASLFEKADIGFRAGNFFYSRRIGQKINFNESDYLRKNEELLSYENKPKLLNSVKITGTTEKKLSIGIKCYHR